MSEEQVRKAEGKNEVKYAQAQNGNRRGRGSYFYKYGRAAKEVGQITDNDRAVVDAANQAAFGHPVSGCCCKV
ncbi:hypothetical protein GCM10028895_34840 [Pontibacter rugosus]